MSSEDQEIVIAVMGPTGVGKSSFVRLVTGRNDIMVGDRLVSETNKITSYKFRPGTKSIVLVDTPGFDDTFISDRDVLRTLSRWLENSYHDGQLLTGIVYLHRISDPRMQGSALRYLYMFKKLCGEDALSNVVLGTTFWDTMVGDTEVAEIRERELIDSEDMWGGMISQGSKAFRKTNDKNEMLTLLQTISDRPPFVLSIQKEMVEQGKYIDETDAGKILVGLKALVKKHEEELREVVTARDREIAQQKEQHAQRLAEQKRTWEFRLREEDEARAKRSREANEAAERLQRRLRDLEIQNSNLDERLQDQSKNQLTSSGPRPSPGVHADMMRVRSLDAPSNRRDILQAIENSLSHFDQEKSRGMITFVTKPLSRINTRFCDLCFSTIGASIYYTCPSCYNGDFNICRPCSESGFTCGLVEHVPTYSRRKETVNGLFCPRIARPPNHNPLPCNKCRKDVGFCYFHCCNCSSDSFDLCFDCALRGRKCLKWASSGGHPMSMYFRPALLTTRQSYRSNSMPGLSRWLPNIGNKV